MVITVKGKEHQVSRNDVDRFISNIKKGIEFSIREVAPDKTYERKYIK